MTKPMFKIVSTENAKTERRTVRTDVDHIKITLATGQVLTIYAVKANMARCLISDGSGRQYNAKIHLTGKIGIFDIAL